MNDEEKDLVRKECSELLERFMKGNENTKVLGPYTRKLDGRKTATIITKTPSGVETIHMSWPKLIMTVLMGGDVDYDKTIDHIDRDHTNDDPFNLRVICRSAHASDDALRVAVAEMICPLCNNSFIPTKAQRNQGTRTTVLANKAGPFCSKSCAGKYGASVQNGGERLERNPVKKEYYRKEK